MIRFLVAFVLCGFSIASVAAAPPPCDPGPKAIQEWKGYDTAHPQFRKITHIAVAPSGSVYLLDQELGLIREFSPEGTFLKTWELPEGSEPLVALAASDSFLYVSDGHSTFQLFKNGSIATWRRGAASNGLAVDKEGNLYLSTTLLRIKGLELRKKMLRPDYYRSKRDSLISEVGIWKLSSDGKVLGHWDAPAWPITVDNNGKLYAVDPDSGGAVLVMVDGREVKRLAPGLGGTGSNSRSLAMAPSGHLLLNEYRNVVEIDAEGKVLQRWCDPGSQYDPLSGPISLTVDGQGRLYVADYYNSRVLKFDLGTN